MRLTIKLGFISFLILVIVVVSSGGCASNKIYNPSTDVWEKHKGYGWMNQQDANPNIEYNICVGNIVWSVLLSETILAPVFLTGFGLWEPQSYIITPQQEALNKIQNKVQLEDTENK